MKRDMFALSWLTKLEDVEKLEEPTREDYRKLVEQMLDDFDEIYQNQETRHKQEIQRLEKRIEKLKERQQEELDNFIMDACVYAYNMPIK